VEARKGNRVETLARAIREYCAGHADPAQATRYARYFKEGYDAWGIVDGKHALWIEQLPRWAEEYGDLKLSGFLELGDLLFKGGKYEEGALAIHFVARFSDEIDNKAIARLGKWFEAGIANWAHTDAFCGMILSPLLEHGRIELDVLAGWRESKFKYQRRAVPVAMLGLLKKNGDVPRLLKFLVPLMADSEKVVQQGLGWFLREAWKKQPEPVEALLLEWKDRGARVIFQYATEKMSLEDKARFRRTKAAKR
jgi:3-methyladenine DNA glycosylase AlkD